MKRQVEKNAHAALNHEEYENKYNELANKYEEVKSKVEEIEERIFSQKIKFENLKEFIGRLGKYDSLIEEFDEDIFNCSIKNMVLQSNDI